MMKQEVETVASEWRFTTKDLAEKSELLMPGHRACAGCGPAIAYRQILKATRGPVIATNATGCMEVVTTIYPYTSWRIPWIHTAFENVAANASGIDAALKAMKKKGQLKYDQVDIIAFAGDGGTYDIGIQALSGAVERGHDFLYVLYDNEAYMNTGVQRSGSTPQYASTTTTPVGKIWRGKKERRKNVPLIMATHKIPYIATASIAYIPDLRRKVEKAAKVTSGGEGLAYLHIQQPCPTGWYFPTEKTVEVGRLAVQTGMWPILEIENGVTKLTVKPRKLKPVEEYLKLQRRFRHVSKEQIATIQSEVDKDWESWLALEKLGKLPWY